MCERETGPFQFLAPAVAPGYRWSGSKKWELQLPGFHSNVDAGRVERGKIYRLLEREMGQKSKRGWKDGNVARVGVGGDDGEKEVDLINSDGGGGGERKKDGLRVKTEAEEGSEAQTWIPKTCHRTPPPSGAPGRHRRKQKRSVFQHTWTCEAQ